MSILKWLFKDKSQQTVIPTIFPPAKEMAKRANERMLISSEELLEKIQKTADEGKLQLRLVDVHLSEQTIKELRQQGYQIDSDTRYERPVYLIMW